MIGSSDYLLGYSGTRANNWNLDDIFFLLELAAAPKELKDWLGSKQKLLDELIANDDYDPLNTS